MRNWPYAYMLLVTETILSRMVKKFKGTFSQNYIRILYNCTDKNGVLKMYTCCYSIMRMIQFLVNIKAGMMK